MLKKGGVVARTFLTGFVEEVLDEDVVGVQTGSFHGPRGP